MYDMNLNELLNTAKALRDEKSELEKGVKELSRSLEEIKQQIQIKMHAEGIERTAADGITVSLSDVTVYSIGEYELFHNFVMNSGHTGLLQRRISNTYVNELLNDPNTDLASIPGLTAFEKQNVNLRVS